MGVTLTRQAPFINRVEDDILFFFSTDNLYSSTGTAASLIFQYDSDPVEDETLTIQLANYGTLVFTFKDSPDNSGTQLPTRGADTLDVFLDNIVTYLKKNYILNTYYEISWFLFILGYNVVIQARDVGEIYIIDSFACDNTRFVELVLVDGEDDVKRENYTMVMQIWVQNNGAYELAGEERIAPGNDLTARFNASDYIQPYIKANFNWEYDSLNSVYNWPENYRNFYVTYGESYGLDAHVYGMTESSDMIAVPGKTHKRTFNEKYIDNISVWNTYKEVFNTLNEFLTNQPSIKKTRKDYPEKLYLPFIPAEDNTGIEVKYKLYYTDSTTDTVTVVNTHNDECIFEINTDVWNNVLEEENPTKEIEKYEVWVERPDGTVISNVQTYVIDYSNYHHEHVFFFRNNRGGFEVARMFGVKSIDTEYEKDMLTHGPSLENPLERIKKITSNVDAEDIIKVNTGHITLQDMDWLSEFFESEDVGAYEWINKKLIPIHIDKSTIHKFENKNFVLSMSFEYRRAQDFIEIDKKPIWLDFDFSTAGIWEKKKVDLTTNNPDLVYWNDDPVTAYKFTSTTTLIAVLMYPVGEGVLLSGTKYRIEIDFQNSNPINYKVIPYITGIEGTTEIVNDDRVTIIQEFVAQPSALSDIMVKVVNPLAAPDGSITFIHSIRIRKCLE